MADTVEVTLQVPTREGDTGERVTVSPERARELVEGGVALYATKPAARAAGGDPNKAATANKG